MNLKRHHVLYGLLAVSLITALVVLLTPNVPNLSFMHRNNSAGTAAETLQPMSFDVVTSIPDQERGLGGRESIPQNYGMLFVFPNPMRVGFWMKDMLVPIDIVWLSDSGTILGIEDNVNPDTYPQSFFPPEPVRYVLETKAGETRRRGWEVGSHVTLPLPYGS